MACNADTKTAGGSLFLPSPFSSYSPPPLQVCQMKNFKPSFVLWSVPHTLKLHFWGITFLEMIHQLSADPRHHVNNAIHNLGNSAPCVSILTYSWARLSIST
jgi:hypothetical protein